MDPLIAEQPAVPQSWNRYAYVQNSPVSFLDPSGLSRCTYSIETHCLTCKSDDGTHSFGTCDTWSGSGECRDDPACEATPFEGPIPRGWWDTGCMGCTPPHRVPRVPIVPQEGTPTFGRGPFQFHQGVGPGASAGCIVMPPDVYKDFTEFYEIDDDGTLIVSD